MKKLSKVIAVAVLTLAPFVFGGATAGAQSFTCEIGYTGPNSNNQCEAKEKYTCDVKNTNDVEIKNSNDQVVASGTVGTSGNTTGGNATSGSVTNTNGTTFSVTITNANPQTQTPGTCFATVVVPATPVQPTPPTPTTPTGGGAVKGATVQPTTGGGAAVLPATSSNTVLSTLAIVAGSLAALTALGVGGIALYRYYKSL